MGRRRKDPKLLDAKGTFQKHPEFRPKGFDPLAPDPKPSISLKPPQRLSEEMRALWVELAAKANPKSLVSEGDLQLFEVFVGLTHKMRNGQSHNGQQLISLTTRFLPTTPAIAQTAVAQPVESKLTSFLRRKAEHDARYNALSKDEKSAITKNEAQKIDDHLASVAAGGPTGAERLEAALAEAAAKRAAKFN